jgi:hypothetical protein
MCPSAAPRQDRGPMLLRCIEGRLSQFAELISTTQGRATALQGLKAACEAGSLL